jgi:hypothetical protein
MLNIERILCQDRLLRATTGLNRKAFEILLEQFRQVYFAEFDKRETPRKRKMGGGRKGRLKTIKQKLFYILFYFKCYPTFDSDIYRNRLSNFDDRLMLTACGLWNFYLEAA